MLSADQLPVSSISQRGGASLRRLLVKCGLSPGRTWAMAKIEPFQDRLTRILPGIIADLTIFRAVIICGAGGRSHLCLAHVISEFDRATWFRAPSQDRK